MEAMESGGLYNLGDEAEVRALSTAIVAALMPADNVVVQGKASPPPEQLLVSLWTALMTTSTTTVIPINRVG